VDWQTVGAALERARPLWVAAGIGSVLAGFVFRSLRWCLLLRPVARVSFRDSFSTTAIGFGASMILPLRLGELIRPALLARRAGVPVAAALSTVVLERLLDMVSMVGCFLLVTLVYPVPGALRAAAGGLAAGAGGGLVVLWLMQRRREWAEGFLETVLGRLPPRFADPVRHMMAGFLDGLRALADLRTVAMVAVHSGLLWTAFGLSYLFGLLALDVEAPLVSAALVTLVFVAACVFLPQAPGFVGTWQMGCVLSLVNVFQVPRDLAVSYSLLTWAVTTGVNVALGGIFVSREDVSLRQLLTLGRSEPPAAHAGR